MNSLKSAILANAKSKLRPDESSYLSLSHAKESEIMSKTSWSRREIQIAALENDVVPERYARNQLYYSMEDQIQLLRTHIGVVGLGGLGGAVTEILCRLGVGSLTLVDGDCFDESNLNRQLLSSTENLGKMKALVAADRVREVNPAVSAYPVTDFLAAENGESILSNADIVVDCLDTIDTRFTLQETCKSLNVPFISGAVGGTAGQVTTIYPDSQSLEMIYGPRSSLRKRGIEANLGTVAYSAVAVAALQCLEVATLVTGNPSRFLNKLLLADLYLPSIDIVEFS